MAYDLASIDATASQAEKRATLENMGEAEYESLPTNNLASHMLAGAGAGIMEHTVMYPVDCVKTRMMSIRPQTDPHYRGLVQAVTKIATTESPRTLFRGMSVVAIAAGPAHALYFAVYETVKTTVSRNNSVISQGVAGVCSTLIHDGFMNPVDVVKQRLQMYHSPYKGAIDCIMKVYKSEGMQAFYRSYTTQLSMNIPFQVLHFITYEALQDLINKDRHYSPLSHVISGAGAGGLAAAVTNPLDVAKTFLNTEQQAKVLSKQHRIRGIIGAMRTIYRTVGVKGYFKGVTARVTFQVPSTAICWSVYELFKYLLGLKTTKQSSDTVL